MSSYTDLKKFNQTISVDLFNAAKAVRNNTKSLENLVKAQPYDIEAVLGIAKLNAFNTFDIVIKKSDNIYSTLKNNIVDAYTFNCIINMCDDIIIQYLCENIHHFGYMLRSEKSAAHQLYFALPFIMDFEYSLDTFESKLNKTKELLKRAVNQYLGKGISIEYVSKFERELNSCKTFNDIYTLRSRIVNNAKKYSEGK